MAQAYADAGFEVWVTDIDTGALNALPDGWHCHAVSANDESAVAVLFGQIAAAGGLDVLCANAGIAGPTAAIEDVDLNDRRACVSVNLEGAFCRRNTQPR